MPKSLTTLFMATIFSIMLNGFTFADDVPYKIESKWSREYSNYCIWYRSGNNCGEREGWRTKYWIEITSIVDEIEVMDVKVNRGNCDLSLDPVISRMKFYGLKSFKLKYGETIILKHNCTILSVDLVTDQGSFTSTFK